MFSISPEQKGASASSMYVLGLVCTVCLPTVMLLQSATPGLAWMACASWSQNHRWDKGMLNHEVFDFSGVEKFMVEKFMVEKFMVEKLIIEKFIAKKLVVEIGWKIQIH